MGGILAKRRDFDHTRGLSMSLQKEWLTYETIPYEKMPSDAIEETKKFIESFRNEQKVYTYGAGDELGFFTRQLDRLDRFRSDERPKDVLHSIQRKPSKWINEVGNRLLIKSLDESQRLCKDSRYVFFPLQYPYESRLTTQSPEFFRQEFLIEYLSRILPDTVELFVKQHPNHPEQPRVRTVRQLNQRDNVIFLNPQLNAHQVISNSAATIVINNTVGFEATFYDVPVFVLGNAFYQQLPSVINIDDLSTLPEVMGSLEDHRPTKNERISGVHSLRNSTIPSIFFLLREGKEREAKKRVDSVINSLLAAIESI